MGELAKIGLIPSQCKNCYQSKAREIVQMIGNMLADRWPGFQSLAAHTLQSTKLRVTLSISGCGATTTKEKRPKATKLEMVYRNEII